MSKRFRQNYGYLPPKEAHTIPWNEVHVDCIGPYIVKQICKTTSKIIYLKLCDLTIIYPATSWFEISAIYYNDMSSDKISNLFYDNWLARYPHPLSITYDNDSEFKKNFKTIIDIYHLKRKPTTIKNPQSNGILKLVHRTIKSMLRSFNLDELTLDPHDPFGEILARVAWDVRSTYHTSLEATPGQLVFRRDMILDLSYIAN